MDVVGIADGKVEVGRKNQGLMPHPCRRCHGHAHAFLVQHGVIPGVPSPLTSHLQLLTFVSGMCIGHEGANTF